MSTPRLLLAVLLLAACGGGGGGDPAPADPGTPSPPSTSPPTTDPPTTNPPVTNPPITNPPAPQPATAASYWPLTAGSRWTYDIDDAVKGRIQKTVEVIGEEPVPDSTARAARVRDVEQTTVAHEEWSWQVESPDGLVSRLREEDRRDGTLVRTTTFAPGGPKALAQAFPAGWRHQVTVVETTRTSTTKAVQKTYEWRVVAERESVQTPAGTFQAMKVERQRVDPHLNPEPVKTYWFAPGVGKVREESTERTEVLSAYSVR